MSKPSDVWNTVITAVFAFFFYLLFRGAFSPFVTQMAFGALFGLIAGLIPLGVGKLRGEAAPVWTLWACAAAGALGGLILAGPLALGLAVWLGTREPARQARPTL